MTTRLYFVHALSPLHAGTGQGSGVIDLPIAREKATGLPYLPGSSVKGVLRDKARAADYEEQLSRKVAQDKLAESDLTYALFGPKTENASDHAGSLQVADARLLLLPVRSLRGTFAWVTSPYVLRRFARDAADTKQVGMPQLPILTDEQCDVAPSTKLTIHLPRQAANVAGVVLEDLDLVQQPQHARAWATWLSDKIFPATDKTWPTLVTERLCIVSDDVLNFLLSTSIEVIARNRLDDTTKTVAKGALWYEEALPAETVLYGLAAITPTQKVRQTHNDAVLVAKLNNLSSSGMQLGGKATVGRGLCRLRLLGEG